MDKIINAMCACGDYVSSINKDSILLVPCEHIIHFKCVHKIINSRCPLCKQKVNKLYTYKEIQSIWRKTNNPTFYQRYVDMASIKYMWDTGSTNPFKALANIPILSFHLLQLLKCKNESDVHDILGGVLDLANFKINIKGSQNLLKDTKVIISNHTTEMDALVIGYAFRCAFLASSQIKKTWHGKKIAETAPVILLDRGKSKNTVQKIKEYMDEKKKSVCIFPEGFLTNQKTLARFRSGAFNTSYPVQPIMVMYDPPINDDNPVTLITKLFSQKQIDVTIHILPIQYQPFNKDKIEKVRHMMGKSCNVALSRVSNRDIKD